MSKAKELFLNAIENLVPEQWDDYLTEACDGDESLRAHLAQLLAAHQQPDSLLQGAEIVGSMRAAQSTDCLGTLVGRYKLLQELGEGGFGIVYLAEQTEPVRRRVALKILKPGMDTKEVVARFEVERQALALMNHPHIARVLDGGATSEGRPYFVMELVKGQPITDYCKENSLDTRQRLQLFVAVAQAVQHAHHKGIIHRDIKPSNVLVTRQEGKPIPKVIDFGIAKAIHQNLTDKTLVTRFGQLIGTPQYISPEQSEISGMDVDTRSDIYSLGALLYELLTGSPPFAPDRFRSASFAEVIRIIRDEQPPCPSQRLSTLHGAEPGTDQRHADSSALLRSLLGDLDWIVMKALEKDRDRRYDSAAALADDVVRYLNNEPVSARPPSLGYRFKKFAGRNKVALATGLAFAGVLIAATFISIGLARRAQREANRANVTLDELRGSAPAFLTEARSLVAKEKFDEAVAKLDYASKLQPENVAYVLARADLLECQLKFAEAAASYREALRVDPDSSHAKVNLRQCEELLDQGTDSEGNYSLDLLAELHSQMQAEQRTAAELLPIARLLGEEQQHLRAYWFQRLQDLPISGNRPLDERLSLAENGIFTLDLSKTQVRDLSALEGMPVGNLNLSDCPQLETIEPLATLPLETLNLSHTPVRDLAPLRHMQSLKELNVSGTEIRNLEPLSDLALKKLSLNQCPVEDLAALKGMPLEELLLGFTRVNSLQPLRGMPLRVLDASYIPASDIKSLHGAPLERLSLSWTRVGYLGFLRGMPLRELSLWGCQKAHTYSTLGEIDSLEVLLLPENCINSLSERDREAIDALEQHRYLSRISDRLPANGNLTAVAQGGEFWPVWKAKRSLQKRLLEHRVECLIRSVDAETWDVEIATPAFDDLSLLAGEPIRDLNINGTKVGDLQPVKDLPKLRTLWAGQTAIMSIEPLRGTKITRLSLLETPVEDLSPLAEVPGLRQLWLGNTPIKTLEPLRGLKLSMLRIENAAIDDLSPLRGMPLETLVLSGTRVTDLEPLRGAPLKLLYLNFTPLSDLAPLASCSTLEKVLLPAGARDVECLRSLPHLDWLEYGWSPTTTDPATTAREFWSVLSSQGQRPPLDQAVRAVEPLGRNGFPQQAADVLAASLADAPKEDTVLERMVACALLVAAGNLEAYRHEAEELLADNGTTDSPYAADQTLKACLIAPEPVGTPDVWDALWATAETNRSDIEFEPWLYLSAALRSFREAKFHQSIEDSDVLVHRQAAPLEAKVAALAVRSMAFRNLGDTESAQQALDEGERLIAPFWPYPQQWSRASWHDWLIARVLLDEAGRQSH